MNALEKRRLPRFVQSRAALVALLAFVTVCGLFVILRSPEVVVIAKGRVYQSAALPSEELEHLVRRLDIRTVIDLRSIDESVAVEHEDEVLAAVGVEHVHIPSEQVPDEPTLERFLDTMESCTYPVLIHCHHGRGRAVLFSAVYRIEFEGWDPEDARQATRNRLRIESSSFATDEPKGRYLREYVPHRHPAGAPEAAGRESSL